MNDTVIYASSSTLSIIEKMSLFKKHNEKGGNDNIFFNPRMFLKLYKGKVIKSDLNNVTVFFEKDKNFLLYSLLKKIDTAIYTNVQSKFSLDIKKRYNLFYETDTAFSLKLFLPKNHGTYCVKAFDKIHGTQQVAKFVIPPINCLIDSFDVEIKNIWIKNKTFGINLELKSLLYDFDAL
jgi:hypothetical protein